MKLDENTLAKLHTTLLEILEEIDRICRKHNIQYFLDSGTALGAVRHGGFIPWDDDADVGMIRSEYERFVKIAAEELGERFFLQTRETDPDFLKFSAKIRMNNTYFPEERNEGTSVHQGIFVDIFPFDYINDDPKKAVSEIKKARRLFKLWAIRHRHPKREKIGRKVVRLCFKILPEYYFENRCRSHFLKYNEKHTMTVVSYSYKMNNYKILCFRIEDMFPSIDIRFQGKEFKIMNNYDSYLKTMYGDYMEMPPLEKRVCHVNGDIKFE